MIAAVGLTKACRCAPEIFFQTIKPYYDQTFSFPKFDITKPLKFFQIHGHYEDLIIFQILAYQTLLVKPLYDDIMVLWEEIIFQSMVDLTLRTMGSLNTLIPMMIQMISNQIKLCSYL